MSQNVTSSPSPHPKDVHVKEFLHRSPRKTVLGPIRCVGDMSSYLSSPLRRATCLPSTPLSLRSVVYTQVQLSSLIPTRLQSLTLLSRPDRTLEQFTRYCHQTSLRVVLEVQETRRRCNGPQPLRSDTHQVTEKTP